MKKFDWRSPRSAPAQAVLRHDRRADALVSNAAAVTAATGCAVAVSTSAASSVRDPRPTAIGTRHEVAAHTAAREDARRALSHLSSSRNRAGALVGCSLLAVSAGDVDHGGGVDGGAAHGSDANTHRGALDRLRRSRVTANGSASRALSRI